MKPREFWDSTYREIIVFCTANSCKVADDLKCEINLQEVITDKLIQSNPLLYEKPKIVRLKDMFQNLFKKEEKEQTLEEQRKILKG